MIRGQEKLCQRVDRLTLDTMPRTLLLLGEYGSGKHLLTKYIGDKFQLEIEDISDILTLETIDMITTRVSPKIYLIEGSKLTPKNENVILKFLEEPLKNAFIVVTSESKQGIIPTVLNRCQVWELSTYSVELLRTFIDSQDEDNDILLKLADTPGKIMEYQHYPIKDMLDLSRKIFNNMARANFANVLTLSRFVAFKNEKDKFDFNLFLDVLLEVSLDNCRLNFPNSIEIYKLTNALNNSKYTFNIDKKALFENYLINLKLLSVSG